MNKKIQKYQRARKIVQNRKQNQKNIQKEVNFRKVIFSLIIKVWFLRKKITLFTILYIGYFIGYNVGNNSIKDQIGRSKDEIYRLQKNLEKIPELESILQVKEMQIKKMNDKVQEKEILLEISSDKFNKLKNEFQDINNNFLETKKKQIEFSKKLLKKDAIIDTIKNSLKDVELKANKNHLLVTVESEKKMNQLLEIHRKELEIIEDKNEKVKNKLQKEFNEKKSEILKLTDNFFEQIKECEKLQKELENIKSNFSLVQKDLKEKINLLNEQKYENQIMEIQIKNNQQLIQQLEEQLKKKNDELSLCRKEFIEIREKLEQFSNKLNSFENQGQLERILIVLDKIINPILFRR